MTRGCPSPQQPSSRPSLRAASHCVTVPVTISCQCQVSLLANTAAPLHVMPAHSPRCRVLRAGMSRRRHSDPRDMVTGTIRRLQSCVRRATAVRASSYTWMGACGDCPLMLKQRRSGHREGRRDSAGGKTACTSLADSSGELGLHEVCHSPPLRVVAASIGDDKRAA